MDDDEKVLVSKESLDAMADNIRDISKAVKIIDSSEISERVIILLIKDYYQHLTMAHIKQVLHACKNLDLAYTK